MNAKVTKIQSSETGFQQYDPKDASLINSVRLQRKFGLPEDYIELHIYDLNNNLLTSNYRYQNYKSLLTSLPSTSNLQIDLNIDPFFDATGLGYDQGSVKLSYNIFRNLFGSSIDNKFYIKNISTDRTELRIANNNISNDDLSAFYNNFLISFSSEAFYKDFYLNFGGTNLIIGVNILLEENPTQSNLLIKLYEPLPANFELKDQFWLVDELSEPHSFQVDFIIENQEIKDFTYLRGPNFNIKVKDEINSSTDYKNYSQLFSTTSTSSYQQLKSMLDEKSLDINVDYSDYTNFIHFSSAKERLLNFVYKLKLVEDYKGDISTLESSTSTPQVSSSKAIITNNLNEIIEKFDGYEYYLYFESGSKAWPKISGSSPYKNVPVSSSTAMSWLGSDNGSSTLYGGQLYSASLFDSDNQDNLFYTIPEYLRIDPQNKGYESFIYMIGQHFDNIWLYIKAITDLYDNNNNINQGISKDLVSYALKSFGIKLYTNTSAAENIFSYLLGVSTSGSFLPSTGSEQITTYVTASNITLPGSDIDKEVYKRIYHNLPFLLKTKGTERGLRALMACYGIPDTILHINEFGGTDKDSGSVEQFFDRLSYALNTKTGSVYVSTPWAPTVYQNILSSSRNIVPDTVEFRFKTNGIPSTNFYSQSLFQVNSGSNTQFGIQLLFTSESNSGSYNDYGDLRLVISGNQGYTYSQPIHLPFFNDDWWNVMVVRETGSIPSSNISSSNKYSIYAANSIYRGSDGEDIGYLGSASLFITGSSVSSSYHNSWNSFSTSSFLTYLGGADSNNKIASGSVKFNGFFQELRFWSIPLPVQNFIDHTLNPLSYEALNETGSYGPLSFRTPLGNDLNLGSGSTVFSVHPTAYLTGSFIYGGVGSTASYATIFSPGLSLYGQAVYGSDVYFGSGTDVVYTSNTQFYYLNAGNLGLRKPTNNKIRIIDQDIASGSTLSPFIKIEQKPEVPLTKDTNILEIAISPQDQVNSDIINQLGYFDIDEYIGDPRDNSSNQYTKLEDLKKFYFKKYIRSYNIFDLLRLVKYYNNSLFKMIKDFTPARTNVTTGIVIKPNFLERSKYKRNEPITTIPNNLTESVPVERFSGNTGGVFDLNKSYTFNELKPSLVGGVVVSQSRKWAPFTGELSGSVMKITDQSLNNNPYLLRNIPFNTNAFNHSEFNILLNNISSSVKSNKFFDVDYSSNPNIAVNIDLIASGSPLAYAEIQNSNYTLKRHINPRYLGSKTTSQFYNIYTEGDSSYGKTAAIDKHVRKLGLFTNISSSVFFVNKSEVNLKYLVDEFGNLTELNEQNKNWFELQNSFVAGDDTIVAQFDPLKFGNQRRLNGEKNIFTSGYSYDPLFYYSSSDSTLYFVIESSGIKYFNAIPAPTVFMTQDPFGTGGGSGRTLSGDNFGFFDTASSDLGNNFQPGGSTVSTSSYVIPSDGLYSFRINLNLGTYFYDNLRSYVIKNITSSSISFKYLARTNTGFPGFNDRISLSTISVTLGPGSSSTLQGPDGLGMCLYSLVADFSAFPIVNVISSSVTGDLNNASTYITASFAFRVLRNDFGVELTKSYDGFDFKILLSGSTPALGPSYTSDIVLTSSFYRKGEKVSYQVLQASNYIGDFDPNTGTISSSFNKYGDGLYRSITLPTITQTASYNRYPFTIFDKGSSFSLASSVSFITLSSTSGSFITSVGSSSIYFTSSIANLYISSSFSPFSSSLYSSFGDINNIFSASVNDILITNSTDGSKQYNISNIYISTGSFSGSLVFEIDSIFSNETPSNISYILILKRNPNETNTILNFKKQSGPTSYGFIIPNNLHPDVLKNIDSITKEVKTKLLEINN
jgi:hypothetical protein